MESITWDIERRSDGALLVRVHSPVRDGHRLPDAVFSFRAGDPQFKYWQQRYQERQTIAPGTPGHSA